MKIQSKVTAFYLLASLRITKKGDREIVQRQIEIPSKEMVDQIASMDDLIYKE